MSTYFWIPQDTPAHEKLHTSNIHPLVALARGYQHFTHGQETPFPQNTQYTNLTKHSPILALPWNTPTGDTIWQWRPNTPPYTTEGKPLKYVMPTGQNSPIDIHPCAPTQTPTIIITEGLLKADSLYSAQTPTKAWKEDTYKKIYDSQGFTAARDAAREKLATIWANTPDFIAIYSLVGVGNWHNNPEWNAINIKKREIVIAFDADIATNHHVWKQARDLTSMLTANKKVSDVSYLQLPDLNGDPHAGIDDFLHAGYALDTLLHDHVTSTLPDEPTLEESRKNARLGDWIVTPDGCAVEEVAIDRTTNTHTYIPKIDMGGFVSRIVSRRMPTDAEMRTGIIDSSNNESGADNTVNLVLQWKDIHSGEQHHLEMSLPQEVYGHGAPKDWARKKGDLPFAFMNHPDYPMPQKWVSAIKRNSPHIPTHIAWDRMGWVPEGKFVIGNQEISADGMVTLASETFQAISEKAVKADSYGVIEPREDEKVGWYKGWLQSCNTTVAQFIGERAPWADPAVGLFTLAMMLRPTMPIKPQLVAYLYGPPASGKSWTAAALMSGWQHTPGTWTNKRLPGHANDTFASVEMTVSRVPIHVADDFAPSASDVVQRSQEASMEELVRLIYQDGSKARTNKGITMAEVRTPQALLCVTAENEPTNASIKSRAMLVPFRANKSIVSHVALRDFEAMVKTGAPSICTYGIIRTVGLLARQFTWRTVRDTYEAIRDGGRLPEPLAGLFLEGFTSMKDEARAAIEQEYGTFAASSNITRIEENAADLMATLWCAGWMMSKTGVGVGKSLSVGSKVVDYMPELSDIIIEGNPGIDTWCELMNLERLRSIAVLLASVHAEHGISTPAVNFLRGISASLTTGAVFLRDKNVPEHPPYFGEMTPVSFGWVPNGEDKDGGVRWVTRGDPVGWVENCELNNMDESNPTVWLDVKTAFWAVQKKNTDLLPSGTKPTTTFQSLVDEGYALGERQRRRFGGTRHTVIPVAWDTLFDV